MFDDFCTLEKLYLEQRQQQNNNNKVCIYFQRNENNQVQIDRLLECLEFGQCMQDKNVLDMFGEKNYVYEDNNNNQKKESIIIDQSKTGKTIHTLIINAQNQNLMSHDFSHLSNFAKFCCNLISLDIMIDSNVSITHDNIIELCTNIQNHLKKLREFKFDIKYVQINSQSILEIVKHIFYIKSLLSIAFNFDFSFLNNNDWEEIYSQFNKLKKLNSLSLITPYLFQNVKSYEKQIAKTYHKKLLRLVTKNICTHKVQNGFDSDDDMGFDWLNLD